jgi:UDP-N-acetyl-2-amino-2-deoxyglucuronate dehydrogenase
MKKNRDQIRIGLIGCGVISKTHFSAIKTLPQAKLVAVCDSQVGRAEAVGKELGIEWYDSYRKMLLKDDLDLISICTPHGQHVPMGIDSARAKKHVLMEKPLGLGLDKAAKMLLEFKKNRRKLFSVLQVRYNPTVKAVRDAIREGKFGKINNAALVVRWYRPQAYFDRDEWRGSKAEEGGLLLSQGIHYIDILQWIMGPVVSVYGDTITAAHKIETDDLDIAMAKHKNGAWSTIEIGLCTYPKNLECSLTILGSKGTVKISGSALNEIATWEVEDTPLPELAPCVSPNVYAGGLYQGSCPNHVFVYEDLIADLLTGSKRCTTGEDAMDSLRISTAIYASARQKRPVVIK